MTPLLPTDYCIFTTQIDVYYIKDLTFKLSPLGDSVAFPGSSHPTMFPSPQTYKSLILTEFMENAL